LPIKGAFVRKGGMLKNEPQTTIILASKSPRRRYLLNQAGLKFSVIESDFDENSIEPCEPEQYVQLLAKGKALDVAEKNPDKWIIGADTIVLIDNQILGKPQSREDARNMLQQLSGNIHQVLTGFAICNHAENQCYLDTIVTDVQFKELSEREIEWYIHTDEPFDKAGAYAIQGLGTFLVKSVNGSYTNVVGLPICEVIEYLIQEDIVGLHSLNGTTPKAN
jgi:nucleoside triphosphate pyrophosphatase